MNEAAVPIALATATMLAFVLTRVNPLSSNSRRLSLLMIFLAIFGAAVAIAIGIGFARPSLTYASGIREH